MRNEVGDCTYHFWGTVVFKTVNVTFKRLISIPLPPLDGLSTIVVCAALVPISPDIVAISILVESYNLGAVVC